ncbi:AroM family protein [Actinopolymorpha alba]|uniref:AroM family protein n=1 Tax=Actinopolymorpha alba TaxID=533267 RepID=UPI000369FE88|nr:AroM family protein [Actinopolymorpha alba]
MTNGTLGVVTIGQSPRIDMVPEMLPWLRSAVAGTEVEIVERGALDGLSPDEIAALAPSGTANHVLTTRLADGSAVVLDHDPMMARVQVAIRWLEDPAQAGVDATLVVCTGEFPALDHQRPLLLAERLFVAGVRGLCGAEPDGVLGVICPLPEQEGMSLGKWSGVAGRVEVVAASPYVEGARDAVAAAARQLASRGVRWILLDCMGYTEEMRAAARAVSDVPVLLARSVVARLAGEAAA